MIFLLSIQPSFHSVPLVLPTVKIPIESLVNSQMFPDSALESSEPQCYKKPVTYEGICFLLLREGRV